METTGAFRGRTLSVRTFSILPAWDFIGTMIIVFTAMLYRIRLTGSLIHMLAIRACEWFAFAGLATFIFSAGDVAFAVSISATVFAHAHGIDASAIAPHITLWAACLRLL